MPIITVVGLQWGDEGKGRVVDWLAGRADAVIRFNGGHNAGHTIVAGDKVFKLSLLPSGLVQGRRSIIGSGVVVDPWHLLAEIDQLRTAGIDVTPQNLLLDSAASLILPFHRDLDQHMEGGGSGQASLGTTQRGIGPAYEDRVGRRAIRLADLQDDEALAARVDRALSYHNALRRGMNRPEIDLQALLDDLRQVSTAIRPFMRHGSEIRAAMRADDLLLFEGAQGVLLDVDFGTYPYVTSSHCIAPFAAVGANYSPNGAAYHLGVCKAYTTRVGEGPFPTGDDADAAAHLQSVGREVGVNTGRSRTCGWLDLVALRHSVACSRIDGMVLTKLDVLDGMKEIKVCTGYRLDCKTINWFPQQASQMERVSPIYATLPGWAKPTFGARSASEMPAEALEYIRFIEEVSGVDVVAASCSPQRDEMIELRRFAP